MTKLIFLSTIVMVRMLLFMFPSMMLMVDFFSGVKENAFTHVVWDSAAAMPSKLKKPPVTPPDNDLGTALALLQGHCI